MLYLWGFHGAEATASLEWVLIQPLFPILYPLVASLRLSHLLTSLSLLILLLQIVFSFRDCFFVLAMYETISKFGF